MRKIFVSSLLFVLCASNVVADDKAEAHSEVTDRQGTTTVTDSSKETDVSLTGTEKSKTKVDISRDPKGLMNKTKESAEVKSRVEKDGDGSLKAESKDATGTKKRVDVDVDVDKDMDGTTTTTVETDEVVDPKGLMNKTKTETEEKIVTKPDGTQERSVSKEVNGKTVSQSSSSSHGAVHR